MQMQQLRPFDRAQMKLEQILDPNHALCKDDVVWLLEFVKKKVAEKDPSLLELSQPRLLTNFHCFAEVALMLINRRPGQDQEIDRLRKWMAEAVFGLGANR